MSILSRVVTLNLSSIFLIQWTDDEKELHPTLIGATRLLVLHVNQKSQLELAHGQLQDFSGYFGAVVASPHRTGISDPQTHNLRAGHDGGSVGVV